MKGKKRACREVMLLFLYFYFNGGKKDEYIWTDYGRRRRDPVLAP